MKTLFNFILETDQAHLKYRFKQKYSDLYSQVHHTITPKHDILIVSICSKTKDTSAKKRKMPARDVYLGRANQILSEALPDLPVDWVILSGGYGLISSNTEINYYQDAIAELSKEKLREMSDFLGYQSDLKKILEKGHYKKIIFTISDRWVYTLDFSELQKVAGEDCEFITFMSRDRMDQEDFPKPTNNTNIVYKKQYFSAFGSPNISLKEKITVDYLKYIQDHKDIGIKEFIRRVVK